MAGRSRPVHWEFSHNPTEKNQPMKEKLNGVSPMESIALHCQVLEAAVVALIASHPERSVVHLKISELVALQQAHPPCSANPGYSAELRRHTERLLQK